MPSARDDHRHAMSNPDILSAVDLVLIRVPTSLMRAKEPVLSATGGACLAIRDRRRESHAWGQT
jgi:hypothetical protein